MDIIYSYIDFVIEDKVEVLEEEEVEEEENIVEDEFDEIDDEIWGGVIDFISNHVIEKIEKIEKIGEIEKKIAVSAE